MGKTRGDGMVVKGAWLSGGVPNNRSISDYCELPGTLNYMANSRGLILEFIHHLKTF